MTATVHVAGVELIPFAKPGKFASYSETGSPVQQPHVGYVYDDSTSGQARLYGLGKTYPEADYVSGQIIATGDGLEA